MGEKVNRISRTRIALNRLKNTDWLCGTRRRRKCISGGTISTIALELPARRVIEEKAKGRGYEGHREV